MAKTISEHRLVAALVLCLSGLALMPFNPLPSQVFGWELLAGTYGLIFENGFEIGGSKGWTYQAPENMRMFPSPGPDSFHQDYLLDRELVSRYEESGVVLMSGFTATGEPVFSVEARSTELGLEVRMGAALDGDAWRETEWSLLERDARLSIEWQRGHPLAEDGLVYLSVGGELRAWLTDLDNDGLRLKVTGMTQSGARTLLIPQTSPS